MSAPFLLRTICKQPRLWIWYFTEVRWYSILSNGGCFWVVQEDKCYEAISKIISRVNIKYYFNSEYNCNKWWFGTSIRQQLQLVLCIIVISFVELHCRCDKLQAFFMWSVDIVYVLRKRCCVLSDELDYTGCMQYETGIRISTLLEKTASQCSI